MIHLNLLCFNQMQITDRINQNYFRSNQVKIFSDAVKTHATRTRMQIKMRGVTQWISWNLAFSIVNYIIWFSFKCCCHQSIHKRGRTSTIKRTKMRTNASDWHTNNTIKCQMRTRWIAMEIENGLCLAIIRCRHRSKTTICSTIKTDFVLILFGCR